MEISARSSFAISYHLLGMSIIAELLRHSPIWALHTPHSTGTHPPWAQASSTRPPIATGAWHMHPGGSPPMLGAWLGGTSLVVVSNRQNVAKHCGWLLCAAGRVVLPDGAGGIWYMVSMIGDGHVLISLGLRTHDSAASNSARFSSITHPDKSASRLV
jgi:hypothetical protein